MKTNSNTLTPNTPNHATGYLVSEAPNEQLADHLPPLNSGLEGGSTLKEGKQRNNGNRICTRQWSSAAKLDAYLETFEEKQPTKWENYDGVTAEIVSYGIRKIREYRAGNLILAKVQRGRKNPYWEVALLGAKDLYPFDASLTGLKAWPFTTEKAAVLHFNKQLRKVARIPTRNEDGKAKGTSND
jgi:hypothetical protein